jgi:hypothetical protein
MKVQVNETAANKFCTIPDIKRWNKKVIFQESFNTNSSKAPKEKGFGRKLQKPIT